MGRAGIRFRPCFALGLALLISATSADAADTQTPNDLKIPADMRLCETSAYLADQDLAGVAVRKAPGTASPLITMLPAMRMATAPGKSGLELYGADVKVLGTDRKGWFLIADADYEPADDEGGPARKVQTFGTTGAVYKGRGWVHGSRLRTDIVTTRGLHAAPDPASAITTPIDRPGYGPEIEASFLDCAGTALKLRATLKGKVFEGWIAPNGETERVCASQRTNCS